MFERSIYDALPPKLREKVDAKLAVIDEVRTTEDRGHSHTAAVRLVARANGYHASTVFRWLREFRWNGGSANAAAALSPLHEPSMRSLLYSLIVHQSTHSARKRMAQYAFLLGWRYMGLELRQRTLTQLAHDHPHILGDLKHALADLTEARS